ncbi:hypothetical protein [Nocardioides sp. TF02-7]|uniref:hypothetical protein n=1 Tax=Nocardioides sp. TF02-7 TaxID=2917724 RepID=UPI001F062587|nr:hypothetical protein [Nocardioides sp. TF02-7]UMG93560.1 hypothetical protein MF408_05045 [Nocardioides sp. TF02-7]
MAKNRRKPHRAREPRRPTIVRREHDARSVADELPLIKEIKRALYADHPLDLLALVSGVVHLAEPAPLEEPTYDLDELVASFETFDVAATTAALHVIAELTDDEALATRVRTTLLERTQPMPEWLRSLGDTRVEGVVSITEPLRDGDNYLLDVRFADGQRMTYVVLVDNNMGGVVKDAFPAEEPLESVTAKFRMLDEDGDMTHAAVDPADARALLEQALERGAITLGMPEQEAWPVGRPLVRWLLRTMPPGGAVPEVKDWTDEEYAEIVDAFLASPHGAPWRGDGDARSLAESLVWFGSATGTGDPLRWSPVSVEVALADWIPRKVIEDRAVMSRLPEVLRGFVRYAHAERGVPSYRTEPTIAAIDQWEPVYLEALGGPARDAATELAQLAMAHVGGLDLGPEEERAVGGPEALAALTTDPLPDEEFDWSGVPDDLRPKVGEILELCDRAADELFDVEHRTANRRLLRDLLAADAAYFRGRAQARTHAAAVAWLVAAANDSISQYGPVTAGELLEVFGVTSVGDRARRFERMLGIPGERMSGDPVVLGDAGYLVAARRAALIRARLLRG